MLYVHIEYDDFGEYLEVLDDSTEPQEADSYYA